MKISTMDRKPDVDELLRALGKWGRYQLLQTVLVGMDAIPCAFHLLSVVFIGEWEYEFGWINMILD